MSTRYCQDHGDPLDPVYGDCRRCSEHAALKAHVHKRLAAITGDNAATRAPNFYGRSESPRPVSVRYCDRHNERCSGPLGNCQSCNYEEIMVERERLRERLEAQRAEDEEIARMQAELNAKGSWLEGVDGNWDELGNPYKGPLPPPRRLLYRRPRHLRHPRQHRRY